MTAATAPAPHRTGDLFAAYTRHSLPRPADIGAGAWARPLAEPAGGLYDTARRTYLLLAAPRPDFTARAERTALAIGTRLGAPTPAAAAWYGLGHLTTHIAARDALQHLTAAVPDDALPGLLHRVITLLWPSPDRVAAPRAQAGPAGAELRRHLELCGYLRDGSLLFAAVDALSAAAASGSGYPEWTARVVQSMVQRWEESGADPVQRAEQIAAAAEPALL
ncbi:hypothetical protein [Kitasatospora sp. NPDC002965]|uniref:hypothetical protein n=1 Tax=Kitasatospora sp. NPDC002965 TaxID=3154775 RepID=UPI0033A3F1F0